MNYTSNIFWHFSGKTVAEQFTSHKTLLSLSKSYKIYHLGTREWFILYSEIQGNNLVCRGRGGMCGGGVYVCVVRWWYYKTKNQPVSGPNSESARLVRAFYLFSNTKDLSG